MSYKIKITGEGKLEDIILGLKLIANALEKPEIRQTLDSPEPEHLNNSDWVNNTLMFDITKT